MIFNRSAHSTKTKLTPTIKSRSNQALQCLIASLSQSAPLTRHPLSQTILHGSPHTLKQTIKFHKTKILLNSARSALSPARTAIWQKYQCVLAAITTISQPKYTSMREHAFLPALQPSMKTNSIISANNVKIPASSAKIKAHFAPTAIATPHTSISIPLIKRALAFPLALHSCMQMKHKFPFDACNV